ncbi:alpha/beta fold hydrolase [Winogradskyella ursingii]|uniref:alpha/beta fold hydrolase n=1 Tax=Winogradskyella ursingii TaxID=2686079 RepID=UPI00293BCA10|nr:alpha/beta hydrolase [Winogradskyella ursingii]
MYKNISINYSVEGEGEAVVLLHGFLENINMWVDLIPELSKTHKVIAIDLLGHGKTECLGYVHTMEDMADAVYAVLLQLKIGKAKFVGHSMGGYVALALAEKEPQMFNGLCLMNSTFEADDKERKKLRTRSAKMAKTNYEALVRMSFTNLFAPESKLKFKEDFDKALELALQTPVQGYIAAQEGMRLRPDRFNTFKNLEARKLIIIGEKDSIIDGDSIRAQIENTDIKFEALSEGHMSHIENKSELTYILKHFIEK